MRNSLAILLAIVFGAACHARGMRIAFDSPLAHRPCPTAADLRAAFLADSAKRNVDDLPSHAYVTYLLNGQVFAANLRQDSLNYYPTTAAIENYNLAAIRSIKPYAPNKAPAEFGVCASVGVVDMRTTPSP